jgi:hypothetical protein
MFFQMILLYAAVFSFSPKPQDFYQQHIGTPFDLQFSTKSLIVSTPKTTSSISGKGNINWRLDFSDQVFNRHNSVYRIKSYGLEKFDLEGRLLWSFDGCEKLLIFNEYLYCMNSSSTLKLDQDGILLGTSKETGSFLFEHETLALCRKSGTKLELVYLTSSLETKNVLKLDNTQVVDHLFNIGSLAFYKSIKEYEFIVVDLLKKEVKSISDFYNNPKIHNSKVQKLGSSRVVVAIKDQVFVYGSKLEYAFKINPNENYIIASSNDVIAKLSNHGSFLKLDWVDAGVLNTFKVDFDFTLTGNIKLVSLFNFTMMTFEWMHRTVLTESRDEFK